MYNCSLAHKVNHDFMPNVRSVAVSISYSILDIDHGFVSLQFDSVRFGLVGSFKTRRNIKKGEEILSNYGYKNCFLSLKKCPKEVNWFYHQFQSFKAKHPYHPLVEQKRKEARELNAPF